ncbi:YhcN/YlaJ family sporulation lipoprotein [Paenibacillus qinlingensis]|uniref:Uncharacterized protein n=1 Tax=Paenibacillus qinlingensis TaxID=1837343 RepID=A0ABU1NQG7_9BACL|nr:YhcN/YlaJ family sporulation lipoprotein [Paenibacillus qinlingensis]MDR6549714.1 hypothetical protein [Paenibacillus qinlingensis]
MKAVKMSVIMTAALVGLTGCSAAPSNQLEKASVSIQSVGLSDSGSGKLKMNSSDAISGSQAEHLTETQLGKADNPQHQNTYLSMNRELADQVMQETHLGGASIAMTDTNIYVAVDLGERQDKRDNEKAKELSKNNDPATEAGLFGSGVGAQMDWVTAKPMSSESMNAIRHVIKRVYPDSKVYISSNELFVNRMMYYDRQQQKNKRMDTYLYEFNTMVHYTFNSSP